MISAWEDVHYIRSARPNDPRLVASCSLSKRRRSHVYSARSKLLLPRDRNRTRRGSKTEYKIGMNGRSRSPKEHWTARSKRPIGARIRLHPVLWVVLRRWIEESLAERVVREKKTEVAEAWMDFTRVSACLVCSAGVYSRGTKVILESRLPACSIKIFYAIL